MMAMPAPMGGDLGGAREARAPASSLSRALCEELTILSMCFQCNCNVTIKTIPFTGCLLLQTTKPRKVEVHTAVCLPSAGSLIKITASMLLGQSLFSKNPVTSLYMAVCWRRFPITMVEWSSRLFHNGDAHAAAGLGRF